MVGNGSASRLTVLNYAFAIPAPAGNGDVTCQGKAKSHSSFNPELYLYRWNAVDPEQSVFFTPDMFECVRQVIGGHQPVCNFGLPYLSQTHLMLLATCSTVIFSPGISNEIMIQAARNPENPLSFLKDSINGKRTHHISRM
jgi:hypothetical protein